MTGMNGRTAFVDYIFAFDFFNILNSLPFTGEGTAWGGSGDLKQAHINKEFSKIIYF